MKFPSLLKYFSPKPVLDGNESKVISLTCKISNEQDRLLRQQCKALGTTRADYVRKMVFGTQLG
jgi:hypothetical protein